MASHSSILAWEIPWTEQPGRLQSMGSQSQSQLSIHTHTHTHTGCVFLTNGKLVLKVWVDFRLNIILVHLHAKSLQLCPTFCDPVDCSPPCSSVHGISQATILELGCSNKITVDWVAYKQQNFSQIWRLEVWDRVPPWLGGHRLLGCSRPACTLHGRRGSELWRVSFGRALTPLMRAVPLWSNHLPKAPPPNTITLRRRSQHRNFGCG